jgi:hypothetical protein
VNLPADVARCPGQPRLVKEGEWPFPAEDPDCAKCARRVQGIADYMSGACVAWMSAPKAYPCVERLEVRK